MRKFIDPEFFVLMYLIDRYHLMILSRFLYPWGITFSPNLDHFLQPLPLESLGEPLPKLLSLKSFSNIPHRSWLET